jgi:hypothetical protein
MCYDDFDAAEVWTETPRRARKAHKCDECAGVILVGRRYVECSGIQDREPFRLRVHAECMALWRFVEREVCHDKGSILIGGLWEEVSGLQAWPDELPDDHPDHGLVEADEFRWLCKFARALGSDEAVRP